MRIQRIVFSLLAAAALLFSTRPAPASAVSGAAVIPWPESEKWIALTFDDGPRPGTTERLLDGLRERGASATFFLVGSQIRGSEELVKRMRDEGHQVGNHTWSHVKLQNLDSAALTREISRTDAELCRVLGQGTYWVRPPYGLLRAGQQSLFTVPLVHWSVDPEDWKLRNAAADVRAVLGKVKPGAIILMHDSVPASVDAALQLVDTLQPQGYVFVTVEELLALSGVRPQPGVLYHSADRHT